ncbi:hypothetical protein ACVSQB_40420 [Bradyrhizobium elkanii]
MIQHLQGSLAVVADAEQPVGRIELLSVAERAYLLEELNRTAAPYPSEVCIHELFEAEVRRRRWRWSIRTSASAMASSMRGPTSWRII